VTTSDYRSVSPFVIAEKGGDGAGHDLPGAESLVQTAFENLDDDGLNLPQRLDHLVGTLQGIKRDLEKSVA
jgi:hypothetical protein